MNQFTGIGRLSADCEIRYTASGTEVASFTVCCDSGFGDNKKTYFAKCTAWAKLATICGEYLKKGSRVMIQGEMEERKWQDQQGNDRWSTGVTVRNLEMLSSKSSSDREQPPQGDMGEDVPFLDLSKGNSVFSRLGKLIRSGGGN